MTRVAPILGALAAVGAVLGAYLTLGGASYQPAAVADPCRERASRSPDGLQETIEQIALSGLDRGACTLGVSREELVLALRDEESLRRLADEQGLELDVATAAVQEGLLTAIDEAEESGALPGLVASLARGTLSRVSPWRVIEALERLGGLLG